MLRELPELDVRALLSLADLPPLLLSLAVRQPARVLKALSSRDRHQVKGIPSPVDFARGGIERELEDARLPGFLPWSRAFLQHGDNLIRDLLPEVAPGRLRCLAA
jgi:hypothetical protein